MKIQLILLGILFSLAATAQTHKVLFVIADGISADALERMHTPNLDAIAARGCYVRAHVGGDKGTYSETPTISAVGYNSLLTGTWVNKHNVWDNDIKDPDYHYSTIFRVVRESAPHKTEAVFSSWTDNRTKLVGEGLPQTGGLTLDTHADGFELDTVRFPHDRARNFMHIIDDTVASAAAAYVRSSAPDLSWVYLEYTDDMGHMYGDSPQYDTAIAYMDRQVGRIWQAIRYREEHYKEQWLIVITTDHGRDEKTGRGHGGQSLRQRGTWIVANRRFNDYARYSYPGIVDIMPTMARWLDVRLPDSVAREVDGVPLVGPVSLAKPVVNVIEGRLDLSWQSFDTTGSVKVWVTTTNNVRAGGSDAYQLLATVPASREHVDVAVPSSTFYKVVLEGRYNTVNVWTGPAPRP